MSQHRKVMPVDHELSPVFIGGTGRSGTTAVFRVLASGRHIVSAAPELRIHVDPKGALNLLEGIAQNWSPYQADGAVHDFVRLVRACRTNNNIILRIAAFMARKIHVSPQRYTRLALAPYFGCAIYDKMLKELVASLTLGESAGYWAGTRSFTIRPKIYETSPVPQNVAAKIIGNYFDGLYKAIAKRSDLYWIDSSPYSIIHADRLLEIFPGAKFIHVIRHPLDVVTSYLGMHWGGTDVRLLAGRLLHIFERWRVVRGKLPEGSFVELRLEDIADDPQSSWRIITRLLDRYSDYNFDISSITPEAVHRNRWQRQLDEDSRHQAQKILQSVIHEYGYDSSYGRPGTQT